ncbi:hypothetical protein ACJJTC_019240 [Scirpophaga incertulas]
MVLMLLHILHSHAKLQKITMRFLQPGHTYLPNDSEFGDVECALKSNFRLYTPDDYIAVMENCRHAKAFYGFLRTVTPGDFVDDADGLGNSVDFDIDETYIED